MKILIMGLPGSGKTYLAKRLKPLLSVHGITQMKSERWLEIGTSLMMAENDKAKNEHFC